MQYDNAKIGKRIKTERQILDLSQDMLSHKINVNRNTVVQWEKGKTMPRPEDLNKLCTIFDCEMGYLLCEEGYETGKTRAKTDIIEKTGLSRQAIEELIRTKSQRMNNEIDVYSEIIINTELMESICSTAIDIAIQNTPDPTFHEEFDKIFLSFSDQQLLERMQARRKYNVKAIKLLLLEDCKTVFYKALEILSQKIIQKGAKGNVKHHEEEE